MKKLLFTVFMILPFVVVGQEFQLIGDQKWAVDNLSVDEFRNGKKIEQSKTKEEWYKAGYTKNPTWCYYNFDENYAYLGKLYNYYAVSSQENIAPKGWYVPTFFDFFKLVKYLDPLISLDIFANGGSKNIGGSLKTKNKKYWKNKVCDNLDSGFNALPSGGYSPSLRYPEYDWRPKDKRAMFWCLTDWMEINNRIGLNLDLKRLNDVAVVFRLFDYDCDFSADDDPKINGYSLRLIKE